jgi:hypothetical protein
MAAATQIVRAFIIAPLNSAAGFELHGVVPIRVSTSKACATATCSCDPQQPCRARALAADCTGIIRLEEVKAADRAPAAEWRPELERNCYRQQGSGYTRREHLFTTPQLTVPTRS